MSESDVSDALVRLLGEQADNWRTLADLAVDFAPAHVARAAGEAMKDPSVDPGTVLSAAESATAIAPDDTPLLIGSIEPETLDFAPVSTISADPIIPDMDLDFGAGRLEMFDSDDAIEPLHAEEELPEAELEPEVTAEMPTHHMESVDEESVFAIDDELDDVEDDHSDDGDHFDVGD